MHAPPSITVHYFERKAGAGQYSLERVFSTVRENLPPHVRPVVLKCPYESQGVLNRIRNVLWAWRNAGPVNHITGDVHYLAFLLPKRKTLLTIADCAALVKNRGLKRWLLWLFWYRLPVWRVRSVTTISTFIKTQLMDLVRCPADKIRPIHCTVSEEFQPHRKPFCKEEPVLLFMGTTAWNKNLSRVAEALKGLPCRLVIVGALGDEQAGALRESGVVFSRHENLSSEEIVALYQACDVVILASTYEGFGLPIVEGQSIGRPVVTSNVCSMPEVAGAGACLVDPFDVEDIRNSIKRVIEDEAYREDLIEKGFANVGRFAPKRIAAEYAELYETLSP